MQANGQVNCGRHPDTSSPRGLSSLCPGVPIFCLTSTTQVQPSPCLHWPPVLTSRPSLTLGPLSTHQPEGFLGTLTGTLVAEALCQLPAAHGKPCHLPQIGDSSCMGSQLSDICKIVTKKVVELGTMMGILGRWLLADYEEGFSDSQTVRAHPLPPQWRPCQRIR